MYTLQGTNISPWKGIFEDDFPFSQVGYVNSLEGILCIYNPQFKPQFLPFSSAQVIHHHPTPDPWRVEQRHGTSDFFFNHGKEWSHRIRREYLHLPTFAIKKWPGNTYIYLHLPTFTYVYLHLPLQGSNIAGWKMDPAWVGVFPIQNRDIPASYVILPEHNWWISYLGKRKIIFKSDFW